MFRGASTQVNRASLREGVDSRLYFHIHTPFTPSVPLAIVPGGVSIARRALVVRWITRPS